MLKPPQELSDEEEGKIELYLSTLLAVPAESVRLKRKSMAVERDGLFQWPQIALYFFHGVVN